MGSFLQKSDIGWPPRSHDFTLRHITNIAEALRR